PPIGGNPFATTFSQATIVGVVREIPIIGSKELPLMYVSESQFPTVLPEIFMRVSHYDPLLRQHVAQAVASVDQQQAIDEFDSLDHQIFREYVSRYQAAAVLMGMIAVIGLLIALAGIFAV